MGFSWRDRSGGGDGDHPIAARHPAGLGRPKGPAHIDRWSLAMQIRSIFPSSAAIFEKVESIDDDYETPKAPLLLSSASSGPPPCILSTCRRSQRSSSSFSRRRRRSSICRRRSAKPRSSMRTAPCASSSGQHPSAGYVLLKGGVKVAEHYRDGLTILQRTPCGPSLNRGAHCRQAARGRRCSHAGCHIGSNPAQLADWSTVKMESRETTTLADVLT